MYIRITKVCPCLPIVIQANLIYLGLCVCTLKLFRNIVNMASSGYEILHSARATQVIADYPWFCLCILRLISNIFNMTSSGRELLKCSSEKMTLRQSLLYLSSKNNISKVLLTILNMISSDHEITKFDWGTKVCMINDMSYLLILMLSIDEFSLSILQAMNDMIYITQDHVNSLYEWGTKVYTSNNMSNLTALRSLIVKSRLKRVYETSDPHTNRGIPNRCSYKRNVTIKITKILITCVIC